MCTKLRFLVFSLLASFGMLSIVLAAEYVDYFEIDGRIVVDEGGRCRIDYEKCISETKKKYTTDLKGMIKTVTGLPYTKGSEISSYMPPRLAFDFQKGFLKDRVTETKNCEIVYYKCILPDRKFKLEFNPDGTAGRFQDMGPKPAATKEDISVLREEIKKLREELNECKRLPK